MQQLNFLFLGLVLQSISVQSQVINQVCSTGVWSSSFSTIAGVSGSYSAAVNRLYNPYDVFVDTNQNFYIADFSNNRILRFAAGSTGGSSGTTIAGFVAAGSNATNALDSPSAVFVRPNATMYILDSANFRVMRWLAGQPTGAVVVGGRGTGATLDRIGTSYGLTLDAQANIYVSDWTNHRVTMWLDGNTTTGFLVAGGNGAGNTTSQLRNPWGVSIDSSLNLWIVDRGNHRVLRWPRNAVNGTVVAGESGVAGAWSYQFSSPTSITFDQFGNMYIMDSGNNRIQRWAPLSTYGVTVASASMSNPRGLVFDTLGNLLVSDCSNHRLLSFPVSCPLSTTTTVAPTTQSRNRVCATAYWNSTFRTVAGVSGSYSAAADRLTNPMDVFVDGYQYYYVVDSGNSRIQEFGPNAVGGGSGTTIAGFNTAGGSGLSELNTPTAITLDLDGTMYILDNGNFRVVRWIQGQPVGFTVAGGRGTGSTLDRIGTSYALCLDAQSNLYISDWTNHRVTMWLNGNTTTGFLVAGGNALGNTTSQLRNPWGIYVDTNLTLFVVDRGNHRVMRWARNAVNGTLIAGETGVAGAWSYQFSSPTAITFDQFGNMFIMDAGNNRIQKWIPGSTYGITVASASMSNPRGFSFDTYGNLIVADLSNHRIIGFNAVCPASTTTTTPVPTVPTNQICPTAVWSSAFSTVAGVTGSYSAAANRLTNPCDVVVDGYQNYYIVDSGSSRIMRFAPGSTSGSSGLVFAGYTAAGGSGRSEFDTPSAIALDMDGTM